MATDSGHGSTLTFGTSGYSLNVVGIKPPKKTREPIEDTHLGTTNRMTSRPGDLDKIGRTIVRFQVDVTSALPTTGTAAETITLTWPLQSGSTAANEAGTGMIVDVDLDELTTGSLQMGTLEIQMDGKTGPTFTAES